MHAAFGTIAAIVAAVTAYDGFALYRAVRVNDAIVQADERVRLGQTLSPAVANRRTELAHGLAMARAGDGDGAARSLNGLILRVPLDKVGQAALYDLGNLYLRQALSRAHEDPSVFIPLVELAKQRYRDLLRLNPERWDARYNLERALRLAPEDRAAYSGTEHDNQERRQILGAPDQVSPDLP